MTASSVDTAQQPARIQFTPAGQIRGLVDGAWWPRTRDLVRELPAITQALGTHLPHLERVGFYTNDWDPLSTNKIFIDGTRLQLEGFTVWAPGTARFVGPSGSVWVVVVPPDADPSAARESMMRATASTPIISSES